MAHDIGSKDKSAALTVNKVAVFTQLSGSSYSIFPFWATKEAIWWTGGHLFIYLFMLSEIQRNYRNLLRYKDKHELPNETQL